MHRILSLASIIIAAAVTSAAPALSGNGYVWNPAGSHQTLCETSTFTECQSLPVADWSECAALYSFWADESGNFNISDVSGSKSVAILKSRDCFLSVKAIDQSKGSYAMGDMDIQAILSTALLSHSRGSGLAVQGDVNCNVENGGKATLHWQIYGNSPA